nr:uncharacterized protein LOC109170783 [Ipomoea batatas]GMC76143.1 uncharacterized protein LOC109170783 [Ipomoea batatas]
MGCGVSSMMNADMMDAPSPAHGGRMIHPKRDRDRDRDRDDTIQYPASPSFRVYFKQNDSQDEVDGVKSMPYTSRESSITKVFILIVTPYYFKQMLIIQSLILPFTNQLLYDVAKS